MGLLAFFRRSGTPASKASESPTSAGPESSTSRGSRKDLLRLVLRDSLFRNGIPAAWLTAEVLRAARQGQQTGLHMRLVLRHADPRLPLHAVALERDLLARLRALDPSADTWFSGFSWSFAFADHVGREPLPHPSTWTAPPPERAQPSKAARETRPGADVIEGPVVIQRKSEDARADLERLLALRDDDLRRQVGGDGAFAATSPGGL
ncbi:hypothetical protein HHL11_32050 [Ramlibacter sp. G-1-2-2]|uniref:Uncharacterized protein n=1 Tax=Ramlibacter agri TaxID=2728837 RepID=A0A848HIU2_9BURK|nr:hypothetical protein [Ramlibacter agri]NML48423.1 hypothetical protein [Ramlibacter agri]